jgi:hypothetical protein
MYKQDPVATVRAVQGVVASAVLEVMVAQAGLRERELDVVLVVVLPPRVDASVAVQAAELRQVAVAVRAEMPAVHQVAVVVQVAARAEAVVQVAEAAKVVCVGKLLG